MLKRVHLPLAKEQPCGKLFYHLGQRCPLHDLPKGKRHTTHVPKLAGAWQTSLRRLLPGRRQKARNSLMGYPTWQLGYVVAQESVQAWPVDDNAAQIDWDDNQTSTLGQKGTMPGIPQDGTELTIVEAVIVSHRAVARSWCWLDKIKQRNSFYKTRCEHPYWCCRGLLTLQYVSVIHAPVLECESTNLPLNLLCWLEDNSSWGSGVYEGKNGQMFTKWQQKELYSEPTLLKLTWPACTSHLWWFISDNTNLSKMMSEKLQGG